MRIANAVVLVTGANRGIGLAFARAALERGARRVYAAARDPASVTLLGAVPQLGVYGATKSAAWALTNGLRHELRAQGTQVLGLHMGFVDTDLTRGMDVPKSSPEAIVQLALDGLESGAEEVLADELTRQVKQSLASGAAAYLAAS